MIRFENVTRTYQTRAGEVRALDDVTLHVQAGEFAVVRGPSGSGKTTLLLAAGGMLRPSSGRVLIDDADLYAQSPGERARFRAENIGFVFQMFHLVPYLNVIDNVLLSGGRGIDRKRMPDARALLERLDMARRATHRPAQLSAGERQRVAIARAMLNKPKTILADEPTGNLDPENAQIVYRYLNEYHEAGGTVVIVTHGAAADEFADKIVRLRDGKIDGTPAGGQ